MTSITPGTPLPWRILRGSVFAGKPAHSPVASFVRHDDAAFAAHTANCHPALLEALEGLLSVTERCEYPVPERLAEDMATLQRARAAIALARGEAK